MIRTIVTIGMVAAIAALSVPTAASASSDDRVWYRGRSVPIGALPPWDSRLLHRYHNSYQSGYTPGYTPPWVYASPADRAYGPPSITTCYRAKVRHGNKVRRIRVCD